MFNFMLSIQRHFKLLIKILKAYIGAWPQGFKSQDFENQD